MTVYCLTRRAKRDLAEIWARIAADQPASAENFLASLEKRFHLLAANPYIGRVREELMPPGIRSFPVDNYMMLYRVQGCSVLFLKRSE